MSKSRTGQLTEQFPFPFVYALVLEESIEKQENHWADTIELIFEPNWAADILADILTLTLSALNLLTLQ